MKLTTKTKQSEQMVKEIWHSIAKCIELPPLAVGGPHLIQCFLDPQESPP